MKREDSKIPGVHKKRKMLSAAVDSEKHEGFTLLECIIAKTSKMKPASLWPFPASCGAAFLMNDIGHFLKYVFAWESLMRTYSLFSLIHIFDLLNSLPLWSLSLEEKENSSCVHLGAKCLYMEITLYIYIQMTNKISVAGAAPGEVWKSWNGLMALHLAEVCMLPTWGISCIKQAHALTASSTILIMLSASWQSIHRLL